MMGFPKLGASASRTFLGTTFRKTLGPKYSLASSATCLERLRRESYMVSRTPSMPSLSLALCWTRCTVFRSCETGCEIYSGGRFPHTALLVCDCDYSGHVIGEDNG